MRLDEYKLPHLLYDAHEPGEALPEGEQYNITGTVAGAIIGQSKYKTAYSEWERIRKEIREGGREPSKTNTAMKRGIMLERCLKSQIYDVIREFGEREMEKDYVFMESPGRIHNPKYPNWYAHIDGIFIPKDKAMTPVLLEIKTVAYNFGDWSDETLPSVYYWQILYYLTIMELKECIVVALVNSEFKIMRVVFDKDQSEMLIKSLREFEECILSGTPPEATGLDVEVAAALKASNDTEIKDIDLEAVVSDSRSYLEINEQIDTLNKAKKKLSVQIIQGMNGNKKYDNADIAITVSRSEGRRTINVDRAKRMLSEDKFNAVVSVGKPSERLLIRKKVLK